MNSYVLDASAILALLNNESGSRLVQEVLPGSIISAVNYSETVARLSLSGIPENDIHETLGLLGLTIIPFDEEQAFRAGLLSKSTRQLGLSLGDRACLALALKTGLPTLTSDKAWLGINIGVVIKAIR